MLQRLAEIKIRALLWKEILFSCKPKGLLQRMLLVGRIFVSKIWGTQFQAEERDSIKMQVD